MEAPTVRPPPVAGKGQRGLGVGGFFCGGGVSSEGRHSTRRGCSRSASRRASPSGRHADSGSGAGGRGTVRPFVAAFGS